MSSYHNLIIWQKSDILAKEVYRVTKAFPRSEIYGLTSQLRRAALSVVLNIIEGYARNNKKEFVRFLKISYASLVETEYLIEFAYSQGYLTSKNYEQAGTIRNECGKVLWKFLLSQK